MPNTVPERQVVHVAVGVLLSEDNRVLVSLRPDNLHQGGLWEFPGGKVETGEAVLEALRREFHEEVNLMVHEAEPLMQVHHDYGDKAVLLDVWLSRRFSGDVVGREGQEVRWAEAEVLATLEFPEANAVILEKVLTLL